MPNQIYHGNYRSSNPRTSQFADVFTFAAASDVIAEAILVVVDGVVTSKRVSTSKEVSEHNRGTNHPSGTRLTAVAVLYDVDRNIAKFRARNLAENATSKTLKSLLTGTASDVGDPIAILALSGAPGLPNVLTAVDKVAQVSISDKD